MTIGIVHMSSNTLGDLTAGPAGLTASNGGPDLPRGLLLNFYGFHKRNALWILLG